MNRSAAIRSGLFSMPFTMLDPEQERQIVDVVFVKLYTPFTDFGHWKKKIHSFIRFIVEWYQSGIWPTTRERCGSSRWGLIIWLI